MDYTTKPRIWTERRRYVRFALSGELPGIITNAGGVVFEVLPVDVSQCGLGLLLDPGPKIGDELILRINGESDTPQEFLFVVKWTAKEATIAELPGLAALKHCGLAMVAPKDINLVEFLASFGGVNIEE